MWGTIEKPSGFCLKVAEYSRDLDEISPVGLIVSGTGGTTGKLSLSRVSFGEFIVLIFLDVVVPWKRLLRFNLHWVLCEKLVFMFGVC